MTGVSGTIVPTRKHGNDKGKKPKRGVPTLEHGNDQPRGNDQSAAITEPLRETMRRLRDLGVSAYFDDNHLVVTGVPSWAVRVRIEKILPELALIGLAHSLFGGWPSPWPALRMEAIVRENRCRFCLEFRLYRCRAHKKGISAGVMPAGCDRFAFNDAVYF